MDFKLTPGDWVKFIDYDSNTLSIGLYKFYNSEGYWFDTFYQGKERDEKTFFYINDVWYERELRDHEIISYNEAKEYFGKMFQTIFEGRVKDELK